jgi:radical SAM-linked protein
MNDSSQLVQKTAVRFGKTGQAIYHSHHDMIRFWERAVKRAELPLRLTQGFNPRPRIIFPHTLGLGISSRHEEVELELCAAMDNAEILDRLTRACGGTVEIIDAQTLPPVKKSRQVTATSYRIEGWSGAAVEQLPWVVAAILAMPEIMVERGAPGDRRRLDIRGYVAGLRTDGPPPRLWLDLTHSQAGSARPDEVVKLASSMTNMDWQELRIEKTAMRLE